MGWLGENREVWGEAVEWLAGCADPLSQVFRPGLDTASARETLDELYSMALALGVPPPGRHEEAPETDPAAYCLEVAGGGTEWLNGRYYLVGENYYGFARYERTAAGHKGYSTSHPVSIYRAKMKAGGHCWFIGILSSTAPGIHQDQDYYKTEEFRTLSQMQMPPKHKSQWKPEYHLGKSPMPTVTKRLLKDLPPEEEEFPAGEPTEGGLHRTESESTDEIYAQPVYSYPAPASPGSTADEWEHHQDDTSTEGVSRTNSGVEEWTSQLPIHPAPDSAPNSADDEQGPPDLERTDRHADDYPGVYGLD